MGLYARRIKVCFAISMWEGKERYAKHVHQCGFSSLCVLNLGWLFFDFVSSHYWALAHFFPMSLCSLHLHQRESQRSMPCTFQWKGEKKQGREVNWSLGRENSDERDVLSWSSTHPSSPSSNFITFFLATCPSISFVDLLFDPLSLCPLDTVDTYSSSTSLSFSQVAK